MLTASGIFVMHNINSIIVSAKNTTIVMNSMIPFDKFAVVNENIKNIGSKNMAITYTEINTSLFKISELSICILLFNI
jgi:hypothetical protein